MAVEMTTISCKRVGRRCFLLLAGASPIAISNRWATIASEPAPKKTWEKISQFFLPPAQFRDDLGNLRPVLQFEDGRWVQNAEDWHERCQELLRKWHGLLGPWPPLLKKPFAHEQFREPMGFTRRRIELEIAPGRKTAVYLLTPEGPGPFPAVVDVFYYPEDGAGIKSDRRRQNDFGFQLVQRGFAALCVGQNPTAPRPEADLYYPAWDRAQLQPLSYLAYVAANCHTFLAQRPEIDSNRIGIVGHSYGGKWALFAGALYDKFSAVCVSDPGIVFDETRPNVNYWEPWYLGYLAGTEFRPRGILTDVYPRVGPYRTMRERGDDLHELHALIAPRPFFVAGGSEDPPERWRALNHTVAVNRVLDHEKRVGMSNRLEHRISPEANEQICLFFEHFLKEEP
jgi:dienelactone hydrolase